jgi:hypothetical protein
MQVTKADSIYFDQRSSIQLIMELLLRDINDLPPFGFLQIDHGTDEFWGLVEARRQIVRLETESFLGNEARRLIRQAQEKKDFEPILEGMQIDATSRRAPNTRKRSDTTKEKKNYCCLSGCNKTGTFNCPAPVQNYCEGRLFCSDHSRLHEDHFGSGSKLKKPSHKPGSMVANVQTEITVTSDNVNNESWQAQVPTVDILCAVAECDGLATKFCQRLSIKCDGRKFCSLHGELCSRHAFQVFRTFQHSAGLDDSNDDDDNDNDDDGDCAIENNIIDDADELPNHESSDVIDMKNDNADMNNDKIDVEEPRVDNWCDIIQFTANTYQLEPVEEEFRFGHRTIKTGCKLLYLYDDEWRIAKISPSIHQDKFLIQFLESSDWLYDDLKTSEHGRSNCKWVLLRKKK